MPRTSRSNLTSGPDASSVSEFALRTVPYCVKADYGTLCLVPEELAQPFYTLDSVLLKKGSYRSDVKYIYETEANIVRTSVFSKVTFKDGREGLTVYTQDTDQLSGATSTGKYVGVMPLPLKCRQFKKESDVLYLGDNELAGIEMISDEPAWETPDLAGFVQSFAPYQQMGITSLEDLKEFRDMGFVARVDRCKSAANERIMTYCRDNAAGAPSIQTKILNERRERMMTHIHKVLKKQLEKPFEERFIKVDKLKPDEEPAKVAAAAAAAVVCAVSVEEPAKTVCIAQSAAVAQPQKQPNLVLPESIAARNHARRPGVNPYASSRYGSVISAAGLSAASRRKCLHAYTKSCPMPAVMPAASVVPLTAAALSLRSRTVDTNAVDTLLSLAQTQSPAEAPATSVTPKKTANPPPPSLLPPHQPNTTGPNLCVRHPPKVSVTPVAVEDTPWVTDYVAEESSTEADSNDLAVSDKPAEPPPPKTPQTCSSGARGSRGGVDTTLTLPDSEKRSRKVAAPSTEAPAIIDGAHHASKKLKKSRKPPQPDEAEASDEDDPVLFSKTKKSKYNRHRKGMKYNTVSRQVKDLQAMMAENKAEGEATPLTHFAKLLNIPCPSFVPEGSVENSVYEQMSDGLKAELSELREAKAELEKTLVDMRSQLKALELSNTATVAKFEVLTASHAELKAEQQSSKIEQQNSFEAGLLRGFAAAGAQKPAA